MLGRAGKGLGLDEEDDATGLIGNVYGSGPLLWERARRSPNFVLMRKVPSLVNLAIHFVVV